MTEVIGEGLGPDCVAWRRSPGQRTSAARTQASVGQALVTEWLYVREASFPVLPFGLTSAWKLKQKRLAGVLSEIYDCGKYTKERVMIRSELLDNNDGSVHRVTLW